MVSKKKWSQQVTEHSDAMTLEPGVFARSDPTNIARSVKRSAEHSRRRKAGAYRSAISMLSFYLNRGGKQLPITQRRRIEAAKQELRRLFGRTSTASKNVRHKVASKRPIKRRSAKNHAGSSMAR